MPNESQYSNINWSESELAALTKEKLWLENQLLLAKDDSMSFGINLKDSLVQVQFKGVPLIQAKINYIRPANFLSKANAHFYTTLFAKPFQVLDEQVNFAKKPIKRMKVIAGADAVALTKESVKEKLFYWEFVTDNKLRIVLYGNNSIQDSIAEAPSFTKERLKFELKRKSDNPKNQNYHPTLFLWINDKEAKAIYRSLPKYPKIIFLN
ncbi:MAG: hypothetical protein JW857_12150 [Bacteroidales bacterium]|nr:hypothetical protein [Bacteroidales bacterium]